MARVTHTTETHGSQKDIQLLANKFPELLDSKLSKILNKQIKLDWLSPLSNDEFAEYVDQSFIERLGITNTIIHHLNHFWPNGGAHWDGLAKYEDTVFMMEAKAHISEQKIESTGASQKSLKLIEESLQNTKDFLNVTADISWCRDNYYQYANRIAHLYYLRELNHIDAHLLFIYFLNDSSVSENETQKDWEKAINSVYKSLKLERNNKLSNFIHHIFIDSKQLLK